MGGGGDGCALARRAGDGGGGGVMVEIRALILTSLSALTLGLVLGTVWLANKEYLQLDSRVAYWENQSSQHLKAYEKQRTALDEFGSVLVSDEFSEKLDRLVATSDPNERALRVEIIADQLAGLYVKFPQGAELLDRLNMVSAAATVEERAQLKDGFLKDIQADFDEPVVEAEPYVIVENDYFKPSVPLLLFASIISATMLCVFYLIGRRKQQVEDTKRDLETQKLQIELDRMRHEMRSLALRDLQNDMKRFRRESSIVADNSTVEQFRESDVTDDES
jgi:cell division protein FtsL